MPDDDKGGYLVEKDGEQHLPTRVNGKLDHGLLGAAHAALFSPSGFRGKPYDGPGKEEAKTKLRPLYKEAGLEWPSESNSKNSESGAIRFVVALSEVSASGLVKLPVALTGHWVHPKTKQEIEIGLAELKTAIENFQKKANGEINVDYDHASEMPNLVGGARPSAGRLLSLEPPEPFTDAKGVQRHILYGMYEPTDTARQLISNGEYRFISPALSPNRVDKSTGENQGMTITTVALTNTPVMEEMPRIQLSEGGVALIDVGSVHVDSTSNKVSVSSKQPGAPASGTSKEDTVKKLSIAKCDDGAAVMDGNETVGYVAHSDLKKYHKDHIEPDADDVKGSEEQFAQFLSDVGFEGSTPEQVKAMLQAGQRAQEKEQAEASRKLLLSECVVGAGLDEEKAAGYLADGKVNKQDYSAAREGQRRVAKAVANGRVLPRHSGSALRLFLSDADLFKVMVEEGKPVINLKPTGASRGPSGDPQEAFIALVRQRVDEKKVAYSVALSEVSREHPDMAKAYREAVNGQSA